MRSEIKSNHYDRNKYYNDNTTDMKYEESHFAQVALIAGTALILGREGVKRGYFKNSISSALKYASKYDTIAPAVVKTIRKNINNPVKNAPFSKSFLHKQKYRDIRFEDLKKKSSRTRMYKDIESNLNTFFDKERFGQTKELFKRIQSDVKKEAARMKDISDTEFFKQFKSIKKAKGDMQADGINSVKIKKAEKKMREDLLKNTISSAEEQKQMMKTYGYRHATVSDLYRIDYKDEVNKTAKNAIISPKRNDVSYNESLQNNIKGLMIDNEAGRYISQKDFMNLKIDKSLMINEKGEIIDLRSFKESYKTITSSLANDFKIPIIGINPLKILGVGDLGKETLNFSSVRKGSIQNSIYKRAGEAKTEDDMFFSMGKVYGFDEDGNITKIADNMRANKVYKGSKYVNRNLEGNRKMAGHKKVIYNEYDDTANVINKASSKFSKFMDIGFDDIDDYDMNDLGLNEKLNPSTWINKFTKLVTRRSPLSPHKGVSSVRSYDEIFGSVDLHDYNKYEGGTDYFSVFTKDATKFSDLGDFKGDTWKNFFKQFVAGRDNMGDVTNYTSNLFYLFDRVNSTLSSTGLGLGVESLTSAPGIMKNMLLKRVLPVYAGYNIYQYGVHLTENGEDEKYGGSNNIQKQFAKGIASTDLALHKLKDITNITDIFKAVYNFVPGSDQITELPIIYQLGLDRTAEEQLDYYNTGKDPIRKGRYWESGTSAFTGEKISYWRDNWFRRTMADVDFSDTKYGSREEYFENAPFPTPTHPFAPIRHFITDRYHYDEKHSDDRPYLETAPAFSNIPFVGSLLSPTAGRLIKPVRKMHQDWQEESFFSKGIGNGINMISSNMSLNIGLGEVNQNNTNNYYTPYVYSTAGGNTSLVGLNTDNLKLANAMVMKSSKLNKIASSSVNPTEVAQMSSSGELDYVDPNTLPSQSGLLFNSQELYNNANDFFGLYGFMSSSIFGDANKNSVYVENSSYAYSSSRSFWNSELGGLGGEANEIARRFLKKRLSDSQLINPVRNTMPNWMPGESYYTDFIHGDPYVKIPNGEARLPGEGYERLWGLKPLDLKIGSSFIGKDVNEIVNHFLHYDEVEDGTGTGAIEEGNKLHKSIEREMINSGFAAGSEGDINDERMGITGRYDLLVNDETSQFGTAIMDIKTVNADKFNSVLKSGIIKSHKAQTNFYVRNMGLDKGYIMYVNRDNPAQRKTIGFNYDENLYIETMNNVREARDIIYDKLDKNEISRGDLYEPIDRFRILADVAPYSSEYDQMDSYMSALSLDENQKAEVREIRDRVTAQRNPKRLYEYKYKDIDTQTELVQVGTYLGDGTFSLVGSDNIVKLAGIQLVDQEFEYAQEKMDEYLNSSLRSGAIVQLEYDENPSKRTTSTGRINAIVHTSSGNLNRDLLEKGYAKENDSKNSLDVKVKTNLFERTVGSMLESIAHLDTPINTKFYKVRDAKEDYERSRVYGKEYADWAHPFRDYVKPFVVDRNVERSFLSGVIMAGIVGSWFGKNKFGKVVGAATTAMVVTGGKFLSYGKEVITGTKDRPKRIEKEQEMYEYYDMLKYVKYKRLYSEYLDKARHGNNKVDVEALIEQEDRRGYGIKKMQKETNSFATKLKIAQNRHINPKKLGVWNFSDYPDGYNGLFDFVVDKFSDTFSNLNFLKESIMGKIKFENDRITEDYSNLEFRNSDNKKLNIFDFSKNLKEYREEKFNRKVKEAKKAIAKNRKYAKNARKLLPFTSGDEYNLEYADQLMGLSTLQAALTSKTKSITDEEIQLVLDKTGLKPSYTRKGTIDRRKLLNETNQSINTVSKTLGINEDAVKALMYYKLSQQTMYAYDPGDSVSDLMSAMPKRDRDYFRALQDAPDREKLEILDLVPKYMRRPLESSWGLTVEKKANLQKYFDQHSLPDENWVGWDEGVNIDAVRVKMLKKEGMEFKDNNVWEDDIKMANSAGKIPIPKINPSKKNNDSKNTLRKLFTRDGYSNIQIDMSYYSTDSDTQIYMTTDEKKKYKNEINKVMNEKLV